VVSVGTITLCPPYVTVIGSMSDISPLLSVAT